MSKRRLTGVCGSLALLLAGAAAWADGPGPGHYFQLEKGVLPGTQGGAVDRILISGPPKPPAGAVRGTADLSAVRQNANAKFLGVPAFSWSFGCSPTAAAMIAGYYDRIGYANIYTGPTNGGVMPMDNSSWPFWTDSRGETLAQCPLSATHQGLDGRADRGHVDDYWVGYDSSASDPFSGNWAEHAYGDCTGDYMKTNQTSNYGNPDGSTAFYFYNSGLPLDAAAIKGYDIDMRDGGYGFKLFLESRGYTVTDMFNQRIAPATSGGFTFAQYMQEIDAGRPVLIQLEGHTMAGVGYDEAGETVYVHDTWDYSTHAMTWGGSYAGMLQFGVTVVRLKPLPPPKSGLLLMLPHLWR